MICAPLRVQKVFQHIGSVTGNRNIETQGNTSPSSLFEEVHEGLLLDDAVVVRDLVEPGDVVLVQRHALAGQVVHQSADLDTVPAVTALGEYLNTDIEK